MKKTQKAPDEAHTAAERAVEFTEELAQQINLLHDAVVALNGSKIRRKALLVLLAHLTGMGQREIERVLDGLGDLKNFALKP